ncbi:MAG: AAA family ATPase [Promethearchaeota archaeon]
MELSYLSRIRDKFGWDEFPFSLDIIPEIFAGKEKILSPIIEQLAFGNIIYIEGNYGSGKSQILRHLYFKMRNNPAYSRYLPILIQEPVTSEILAHAFKRKLNIESKITLISDLTEELESVVSRKNSIILLIDEAQELAAQESDSTEIREEKYKTLQWIRVLADFRGCKIFLAGLTNFGKKINEMFRPLEDRVTLNFHLKPLDYESTVELIKERIKYFSVNPSKVISPFEDDAYKRIYQISGGYPRAILKICQESIINMLNKGKDAVTSDDILNISGKARQIALSPSMKDVKRLESADLEMEMKSFHEKLKYDVSSLSDTELQVLKHLATGEEMTPQEVADSCEITPGTAANILRKLKTMGFVFRKKKGRTFSYTLYEVYRREFFEG